MTNLVKTKSFEEIMYDYVLELGLKMPDNPIALCKLGLQIIKDKREEQFIKDVLEDLKIIDLKDIEAEKSLAKLYKSLQVIAKAATQEKINRFKKLTVNGIVYQNEISDNDFDLFVNIIDELTDEEFLILKSKYDGTAIDLERFKIDVFIVRLESKGLLKVQQTPVPIEYSFNANGITHTIVNNYSISELGANLIEFISKNSN